MFGQQTTVEKYLKTKGVDLIFADCPCLKTPFFDENKDPLLIPIELVKISNQEQKYKGRIAESQLCQLTKKSTFSAPHRFKLLKSSMLNEQLIHYSGDHLEFTDYTFGHRFIEVEAKLLTPPMLIYGNGNFYDKHSFGSWKNVGHTEYRTVLANTCTKSGLIKMIVPSIITIQDPHSAPQQNYDVDLSHLRNLMLTLERFGQTVLKKTKDGKAVPAVYSVATHHQSWGIENLRKKVHDIKDRISNDDDLSQLDHEIIPLMVFVFAKCSSKSNTAKTPKLNDHGVIKQVCDGELGVPNQCLLLKTYHSMSANLNKCTTTHGIVYKIFAKIGITHYKLSNFEGTNHWSKLTDKSSPTLVLGIHLAPVQKFHGTSSEVLAVVGNTDIDVSRFGETVRLQKRNENGGVCLENAVTERIVQFEKFAGTKPQHIVVYRCDLSENQFKRALYEEKRDILRACESIDVQYSPTITYIATNRRHHVRFNAVKESDTEGAALNLKPGTLIESAIVSKEYFDFYLCSHSGLLGTVWPTHYYVLDDDWAPSSDFWQKISFALCYNYVVAPKSIKLPNVVRYAEMSTKRARERLSAIREIMCDGKGVFNWTASDGIAWINEQLRSQNEHQGMCYL